MKIIIYIFLVFALYFSIYASDNRLKAIGNMTYSIPDIESQLNLYRIAENNAVLKNNDSTDSMIYTAETKNNWGKLKREWDAYKNQYSFLSFSGQKHLDDNKIFYGDIRYNWDYRGDVDYAIEKKPYGFDPFVLTDYTTGSILYKGPEIFVAFNHLLSNSLYWGISINYNINRGLKTKSSEAEIIDRSIKASFDLVYNISENSRFGLSFSPYQTQDITKLVSQKDGLDPTIRRYRGEFEYRERTGTSDRTADYGGYVIKPQFAFNSENIEHIDYISYYYQWHKLYDGTSTRHYDGYFQAQHYGINTITRYKISDINKTYIFLAYQYQKYDDWGKGPELDLLISQDIYDSHLLNFGGSTFLQNLSSTIALEFCYQLEKPNQIDYLANRDREGDIINWIAKLGIENQIDSIIHIRYGFNFENYSENEVWDYFKDYEGYNFTFGIGWLFSNYEFDFAGNYRIKSNKQDNGIQRSGLNFSLQLKQFLN